MKRLIKKIVAANVEITAIAAALLLLSIVGCSGVRFLPQKQGSSFAAVKGAVSARAVPVNVAFEDVGLTQVGVVVGVTVTGQMEKRVFCGPADVIQCEALLLGQQVEITGNPTGVGFIIATKIKELK